MGELLGVLYEDLVKNDRVLTVPHCIFSKMGLHHRLTVNKQTATAIFFINSSTPLEYHKIKTFPNIASTILAHLSCTFTNLTHLNFIFIGHRQ